MLWLRAAWFGIVVPMMMASEYAGAVEPAESIALRSESVGLRLPDCPEAGLDFESLSRALRLELALDSKSDLVAETASDSKTNPIAESALDSEARASIEIELSCGAATSTVEIRFRDAKGKVVDRRVLLSDLPKPVRARAVALATAELVRSARASLADTKSELTAPSPGTVTDEPGTVAQTTSTTSDAPGPAASPKSPEVLAPSSGSVSLTQGSMQLPRNRKRVMIAVGPTTRFFPPATLPAWGGRAQAHLGRLRLGVDLVAAHVTNWRGSLALGMAEVGAGWELAAYDHPRYHFSLGPRIGAGVAWTPTHAWIAVAVPTGASIGTPIPVAQPVEAGHTTLYLEGALASDLFIHLGKHWSCGLTLELGVARGAGATREESYGEIDGIPLGHRYPLEAGNRTNVVAGASAVIGYAL